MKFLLDMPVGTRVMNWLKNRGFAVSHAREMGLATADDKVLLQRAVAENCVLISMDLDFPAILALTGADRPGVILIRMRDPRPDRICSRLDELFRTHGESQLTASVTILEDSRIRLRELPIR